MLDQIILSDQIIATTDDFPPAGLWAHGTIDVLNEGRIIIYKATGPFNLELVKTLGSLRSSIISKLDALGTSGEIVCIDRSAYATMDALSELSAHFERIKRDGVRASYTAFVIGPEVEGARLMAPLFVKCYAVLGRIPPVFDCFDDARRWMEGKLSGE